MMTVELPQPISDYFAADAEDGAEAVAQCFTDDAVVRDEGETHVGRAAIRSWKVEAGKKYTYSATPFEVARDSDRTVVTAHVAGNFPGSPVDLRYIFELHGEKIAALEVIP
ncbi:nuclear transport factor 2 family protein [Croceibacterium ferulae]|uniref:nuclear transport factor 2 family protein n=1 Tax=Croceibacterium ferulae TaxID=1854641 RepID=UPI001F4D8293|nr:nuclear transport factor 2 family protein [Croceibacterium ferulae]